MKADDILMEFCSNHEEDAKKAQQVLELRFNTLSLITICSMRKTVELFIQKDYSGPAYEVLNYILSTLKKTEWRKLIQIRAKLRGIDYKYSEN